MPSADMFDYIQARAYYGTNAIEWVPALKNKSRTEQLMFMREFEQVMLHAEEQFGIAEKDWLNYILEYCRPGKGYIPNWQYKDYYECEIVSTLVYHKIKENLVKFIRRSLHNRFIETNKEMKGSFIGDFYTGKEDETLSEFMGILHLADISEKIELKAICRNIYIDGKYYGHEALVYHNTDKGYNDFCYHFYFTLAEKLEPETLIHIFTNAFEQAFGNNIKFSLSIKNKENSSCSPITEETAKNTLESRIKSLFSKDRSKEAAPVIRNEEKFILYMYIEEDKKIKNLLSWWYERKNRY